MLIRQRGPCDAHEVWRRYTTYVLWPTWAPQIRSVEVDGPVVRPGASGVVRGMAGLRVPFTVRQVDTRSRTWTWQVGVGPFSVVMDHGVAPTPHGTEAWVDLHLPWPIASAYAVVARVALRRLTRA